MPSALAQALPRLPAHGPFVPLGDSGGGFRRVGQGPGRLVVLPGIVGAADVLAALGEALADTHQTWLVTYPRVGGLSELLAWLDALRALSGGGPVSVYGGSFGGLVAQAWLRHAPQAIEDVVVSGVGPPEAARAERNRRVLPWLARVPMPAWRALLGLAVRLSTTRAPDRAVWRAHYRGDVDALTWPVLESRYLVGIDIDRAGPPSASELAAWRGRMLVLEGTRDRVARGPQRAALRAVYPRASFHVFEGVGHGMALEQPDQWLQVVSTFLRAAPAP